MADSDIPAEAVEAAANVAVLRRLLAHTKSQGWVREPLDVTGDGDHDVVYHNHAWTAPDLRRVVATVCFDLDHQGVPDWWVNVYLGDTTVGIERPEFAQQVADLLAIVGLFHDPRAGERGRVLAEVDAALRDAVNPAAADAWTPVALLAHVADYLAEVLGGEQGCFCGHTRPQHVARCSLCFDCNAFTPAANVLGGDSTPGPLGLAIKADPSLPADTVLVVPPRRTAADLGRQEDESDDELAARTIRLTGLDGDSGEDLFSLDGMVEVIRDPAEIPVIDLRGGDSGGEVG